MFNDGWKGGETCPEEVEEALDAAKRYLSKELYPKYRFDPKIFGVRQDIKGTASIADAAVSRVADKFLFGKPSNVGRWVAQQRELAALGEVFRINCMDERLSDTRPYRVLHPTASLVLERTERQRGCKIEGTIECKAHSLSVRHSLGGPTKHKAVMQRYLSAWPRVVRKDGNKLGDIMMLRLEDLT